MPGGRRRLAAQCAAAISVVAVVAAGCGGGAAPPAPRARHGAPATTHQTAPTTSRPSPTTAAAAPPPADAGAWSLVPPTTLSPDVPAAWTGRLVLVAGGGCCGDVGTVDLAAYDPVTATWGALPPPPLSTRGDAAGAWTGSEMVVAGGVSQPTGTPEVRVATVDGAAWVPATGTWHAIAPLPAPLPMRSVTSVWTGREVLVWCSYASRPEVPGAEAVLASDPAADRWRQLPPSGLTPRDGAVVTWAGTRLFVWGGLDADGHPYGDGALLDPTTGRWAPLLPAPVPARGRAAVAWTGAQVLLWGGQSGPTSQVGRGAAFDPATGRWAALPLSPLRAKTDATGVWSGRLFYVVGGAAGPGLRPATFPVPGPGSAAYDPVARRWTALPSAPTVATGPFRDPAAPTAGDQRAGALGFWTGSQVVVIGGYNCCSQGNLPDGVAWTPAR